MGFLIYLTIGLSAELGQQTTKILEHFTLYLEHEEQC